MRLRDATVDDFPAIVAINQQSLDGVTPIDLAGLTELVALSSRALVADDDGQIAGFVVVIAPGSTYGSINYRWFEANQTFGSYVDRVAIAPTHRRLGVGTLLYDELEQDLPVALEVYVDPPNEASLAFHARRGYGSGATFAGQRQNRCTAGQERRSRLIRATWDGPQKVGLGTRLT